MSIVAEFSIPTETIPIGEALAEMSDVRIELDRVIPTTETVFPFFWLWSDDVERFLDRARDESEIRGVRVLSAFDRCALVRAEWTPDAEIIEAIKALEATILEATGTSDGWAFRVRAESRENLCVFRETFVDQGIPVAVERVYDLSELHTGKRFGVTPEQQEALITAYEEGYYEKPRRVSQSELGSEFGITARAVSDRLRRGTANLVDGTLVSPSYGPGT